MKYRRVIFSLSILMALVFAISASPSHSGGIISPLVIMATARPTPPGDPVPAAYVPLIMFNFSPLATPTARPTP